MKIAIFVLIMQLCETAWASADCYGDPVSGKGFQNFLDSLSLSEKDMKSGLRAMMDEASKGSFFATVYLDAVFYERGRRLSKFNTVSLVNAYKNSHCYGYVYVIVRSQVRPLVYDKEISEGTKANPKVSSWRPSYESSIREAPKWINYFLYGERGGSDIWVETYQEMIHLSDCVGLSDARADAQYLLGAMPQQWKDRLRDSNPRRCANEVRP